MKKLILLILFIPFVSFGQRGNNQSSLKPIDSLTVDMQVSKGLINTYQNSKNQLFFEINKHILEKDFWSLLDLLKFQQITQDI